MRNQPEKLSKDALPDHIRKELEKRQDK